MKATYVRMALVSTLVASCLVLMQSVPAIAADPLAGSGSVLGGEVVEVTAPAQTVLRFKSASITDGVSFFEDVDGNWWSTGANNLNQLGLGDTTDRSTPEVFYDSTRFGATQVQASNSQTMTASGLTSWGKGFPVQAVDELAVPNRATPEITGWTTSAAYVPIRTTVGGSPEDPGATVYPSYFSTGPVTFAIDLSTNFYCPEGTVSVGASPVMNNVAGMAYVNPLPRVWRPGTQETPLYLSVCNPDVEFTSDSLFSVHFDEYQPQYLPDLAPVVDRDGAVSTGGLVALPGNKFFASFSQKGLFGAAVDEDGVVYTWGDAATGARGVPGAVTSRVPTPVTFPLNVGERIVRVETGTNYALALSSEGSLYSWGSNGNGQLGTGDTVDRETPVRVLTNVAFVATSETGHTVAIGTDGRAFVWGANSHGELGLGHTDRMVSPTSLLPDPVQEPPEVLFGQTPASAVVLKEHDEESMTNIWLVTVPEHVAGIVDVTVDGANAGTHTYTFELGLEISPQAPIAVGADYSLTALMADPQEAARPDLVEGVTVALRAQGSADARIVTMRNGRALFADPFQISEAGEVGFEAHAYAGDIVSGVSVSNTTELVASFVLDTVSPTSPPTIEPTTDPIPDRTATPSFLAATGAQVGLAGLGMVLLVVGVAVLILAKRRHAPLARQE